MKKGLSRRPRASDRERDNQGALKTTSRVPIVSCHNFILATRDTGYRSLPTAISELVDNSIQAGASRIEIVIMETDRVPEAQISIGVLDNGCGMDKPTLALALQFGGSTRFGSRTGFGRFGMGLPNSSLSQGRRVDIYTWVRSRSVLHTYLDIDEVLSKARRTIRQPLLGSLPEWVGSAPSPKGTLVVWSRCDRLKHRRIETTIRHLARVLGRVYRYPLWEGLRLEINSRPIEPVDPLYLRCERHAGIASRYGKPMTYELTLSPVQKGTITVQFSRLPVAKWKRRSIEDKRESGLVGGAGVSIVRAGREIDYGWHLLGGKRRENYDDWWRCEIQFDPTLDELFGVTHSKQGITPTPELKALVSNDLEGIARVLNTQVRKAFQKAQIAESRIVSLANQTEPLLPPYTAGLGHGAKWQRPTRYHIAVAPMEGREFYGVEVRNAHVKVTINQDHPFYQRMYFPASTKSDQKDFMVLQCLVLAAARAELAARHGPDAQRLFAFRQNWSDALAAFSRTL